MIPFSRRALLAAPVLLRASRSPNDTPAYVTLGAGNRGLWLHRTFAALGARCIAVSDPYAPHLANAIQATPQAQPFTDWRKALELKQLDFVVVATPDHHHHPMLEAALAAGRDVYLEKPLSMSLEQSDRMVKAVRASNRIVQIGMQRRSMEFIRRAKAIIPQLGRLSLVQARWNWAFLLPLDDSPLEGKLDWDLFLGPAPARPLEPKRYRWWRGFWDYSGGNMTDQGTHLMDVVQWLTDSPPPQAATCAGQVIHAACEVPNVFTAIFEYPGFTATWTLNYRTSYDNDWSIAFHGDNATMFMDRRGYRIYKNLEMTTQPWKAPDRPDLAADFPDDSLPTAHQQNFLDCIRSRKEPNCPVEAAAAAVAGPHMANISWREHRRVVRSA